MARFRSPEPTTPSKIITPAVAKQLGERKKSNQLMLLQQRQELETLLEELK